MRREQREEEARHKAAPGGNSISCSGGTHGGEVRVGSSPRLQDRQADKDSGWPERDTGLGGRVCNDEFVSPPVKFEVTAGCVSEKCPVRLLEIQEAFQTVDLGALLEYTGRTLTWSPQAQQCCAEALPFMNCLFSMLCDALNYRYITPRLSLSE